MAAGIKVVPAVATARAVPKIRRRPDSDAAYWLSGIAGSEPWDGLGERGAENAKKTLASLWTGKCQ